MLKVNERVIVYAALADCQADAVAMRENMARLKALRLTKEAEQSKVFPDPVVPDRKLITVPGRKRRAYAACGREIQAK